MFKNRRLVHVELLEREIFNIVFEAIWEGAESWCLVSITILEHMPELEALTVFQVKILAFTVALYIGWDHYR